MLGVAILGTGAISSSHIEAYLKFPQQCRIVALADLFPEKAAQKSAAYGLDARIYDNYQSLLKDNEVDLVSICLPPFEHAPATIALLQAGKHVLVEKPMAINLEDCDRMIQAAESSGKLLSVVAQNRFKDPLMKLKKVLDSGLIGKINYAQVDSFWWRGDNYYKLWWRGTWEKEGGGPTINHAVHHIDLFQWMMGMPGEVQSLITNLAHKNSEVEDLSITIMRYPNGGVGQLTASLVHHGEEQQMVFQGEHAMVAVPWRVHAQTQRENGFPDRNEALEKEIHAYMNRLPNLTYSGHDGQIANLLAAIDGRENLLVDGREGRKTIELISAIFQSGTSGQKVKLPILPDAPFYTQQGILKNVPHFYEKTSSVDNFSTEEITLGSDYKTSNQ
jgi:predicted dehydrogenase